MLLQEFLHRSAERAPDATALFDLSTEIEVMRSLLARRLLSHGTFTPAGYEGS